MAWLEKRKHRDGRVRYRIRDKINGVKVTVVNDAGQWKPIAQGRLDDYVKKKAAGESGAAALVTSLDEARRGWLLDTTRSAKTVTIYSGALHSFVQWSKATKLEHFTKDKIDGWRDAMETGTLCWTANNGKTWHRYAPMTVKIMLSTLKDFLRYCARQDLLPFKLVQSIKVKKPASTRRFLTREECARLLKACRVETYIQKGGHPGAKPALCKNAYANNRLRKVMLFGLYTGMRLNEVIEARWSDVTRQEVLRRLPDGRVISQILYSLFIPIAKKNKQRTVTFHPILARLLGAAKRIGQPERIFADWTKSGLGQARRRAVRRAGLERVRFHDLRHSFVRNYLKSGAGSVAQLREHTGHENLASLDPYAHFANEDVAATIPKFRIQ